jgi:hypothetical protein
MQIAASDEWQSLTAVTTCQLVLLRPWAFKGTHYGGCPFRMADKSFLAREIRFYTGKTEATAELKACFTGSGGQLTPRPLHSLAAIGRQH